jgi:hypothetical protein
MSFLGDSLRSFVLHKNTRDKVSRLTMVRPDRDMKRVYSFLVSPVAAFLLDGAGVGRRTVRVKISSIV